MNRKMTYLLLPLLAGSAMSTLQARRRHVMVWILLQALAAWIQVVWRRKNERRHPVTTTIIVALEQLGQSGLGADSGTVLIEPVVSTIYTTRTQAKA